MTVPNAITLARIAMIPFFMWSMIAGQPVAALVLFLAASLTDLLDGYLARKMDQVTNFGKLVDPLADKLLVMAALLLLCAGGRLAVWAVMVILSREFIISSLRMVAASSGKVIAAGWSGKIKTTVQIVCISFMISPFEGCNLFSWVTIGLLAGWIMTAVTAWSGIDYLWKHRGVLRENVRNS